MKSRFLTTEDDPRHRRPEQKKNDILPAWGLTA